MKTTVYYFFTRYFVGFIYFFFAEVRSVYFFDEPFTELQLSLPKQGTPLRTEKCLVRHVSATKKSDAMFTRHPLLIPAVGNVRLDSLFFAFWKECRCFTTK